MNTYLRQPCDEGVILSAPATAPCTSQAGPWILAATILGSSIAFIDSTVVNVALPALQADLNATVVDVQWVVEAYALLLAALLLAGGSLGDIYGRRRIYAAGVIIFAAASVWCGLAPDVLQLIIARGVQGIGAALLVPGSLAIISASFSEKDRGRAIGTWSGFTAITGAVGPVIGGWLIERASWRWVFFINLPLALIVLVLTFRHVPESRNPQAAARLDWLGAVSATVGLGGVIYALIESSNRGWRDPVVMIALFLGLTALAAFLAVEAYSRAPMLPLSIFRSRNFSGANLLTLFLYSALSGSLFFFPLNLIQVQGYSATAAGAASLPFVLLMFLLSRWSGGLVERYGARRPLVIGPIIAAGGLALFALPSIGGSYWTTFFPAVVVLGLGMAVSVAPLTTTVMNSVDEAQAGIASGINNAVSRVAAVLAIAVLAIVMLNAFNRSLDSRLIAFNLPPEVRQQLDDQRIKLAAAEVQAGIDSNVRTGIKQSISQSFVSGFRLVMLIASGLALGSAVCAWLIIEDNSITADR
jgi:EmrB/QacA subfamily drug resistance transporter